MNMVGSTISHYRIVEKLGAGGMGVVYKAEDTKLKRTVALKFLPPELTCDPGAKARFIHEAQAASALQHNNICAIHDIDESPDSQLFIVMDCYEGENLKTKIDRGALKAEEAIDIAIQTAQALSEAHRHGIIHRDVKPANILITGKGVAKLVDFGLAKLGGVTRLTKVASTLGTLSYISPEQLQGADVDARADIFSLGVVLYEMLTGKLPFRGDHEAALMYSITNEEPQPIQKHVPDISAELVQVITRVLEKSPQQRYQTADDLIVDLGRVIGRGSAFPKTPLITLRWKQLPKIPHWLRIALVAIPIAIVSIVDPFGLFPWTSSPSNILAVMYFENKADPGDTTTAEMLAELLETSLSQVEGLQVISRERLYEIQKDLGRADIGTLTPALASQVAERAHLSTMLVGSIVKTEPTLVVTARLIDVPSGKNVGSQRIEAFASEELMELADSLAVLLRSNLHVPIIAPVDVRPLAEVTTKSLEAYRSYVEGKNLAKKYYGKEAAAAFERAVSLDDQFAMAYFGLAEARRQTRDYVSQAKALEKAFQLSNKVTERERLQIIAYRYGFQRNHELAIASFEKFLRLYPNEEEAYILLSNNYAIMMELEKCVHTLRRGLRVDATDKNLWNDISYYLALLGRREEAFEAVDRYVSLAPADPNPYDTKGDIFQIFEQPEASREWYQKAVELQNRYGLVKLGREAVTRRDYAQAEECFRSVNYQSVKAAIASHRGQLRKASAQFSSAPKSSATYIDLSCMVHLAYEVDDYRSMLKIAESLPDAPAFLGLRAWALLKNGDSTGAYRVLEDIRRDSTWRFPTTKALYEYAGAVLAYEEERYDTARDRFQKALEILPPRYDAVLPYAITLLKCGDSEGAITFLKRLSGGSLPLFYLYGGFGFDLGWSPFSATYWPISSVKAHYWLGIAYEIEGEKEKAALEYKEFLDIWKDADFMSSELRDAMLRLSKLKEST